MEQQLENKDKQLDKLVTRQEEVSRVAIAQRFCRKFVQARIGSSLTLVRQIPLPSSSLPSPSLLVPYRPFPFSYLPILNPFLPLSFPPQSPTSNNGYGVWGAIVSEPVFASLFFSVILDKWLGFVV